MNKYIKINGEPTPEVIDVFFEYQKNKFDGSEILLEDTTVIKHKLRVKGSDPWSSICDDYGHYLFGWVANKLVALDKSGEYLQKYKKNALDEIKMWINLNWSDCTKTMAQIQARIQTEKSNASSLTTTADVDAVVEDFKTWAGS